MNIFAQQLKQLRIKHGYSMQVLADAAKVSKSMISKIERHEVQPTLDVALRLAQALGKNLSTMLETCEEETIMIIPKGKHSIWEDPVSHLQRKVLSPPFPSSKLEWIEAILPAKAGIELSAMPQDSEKYLLVTRGILTIELMHQQYPLHSGDSCYFAAHYPHALKNLGDKPTQYYLIIKHG